MRSFFSTFVAGWPSTLISPSVGNNRPSRSFIVVVLPEPFGPSSPNTSPLLTDKLSELTARTFRRPQKSR